LLIFKEILKGSEKQMARGGIDYSDIGVLGIPFYADGSVSAIALASATVAGYGVVGKVVTQTGDKIAGFGGAGSPVLGRIGQYEKDGTMTIEVKGIVEVPGVSGKLPTPGGATTGNVVCDGSGGVAVATAGKQVLSVDNTASVNTAFVFLG